MVLFTNLTKYQGYRITASSYSSFSSSFSYLGADNKAICRFNSITQPPTITTTQPCYSLQVNKPWLVECVALNWIILRIRCGWMCEEWVAHAFVLHWITILPFIYLLFSNSSSPTHNQSAQSNPLYHSHCDCPKHGCCSDPGTDRRGSNRHNYQHCHKAGDRLGTGESSTGHEHRHTV